MFSASNAFAFSALSYTIPFFLISGYQIVRPDYYVAGTYVANSTMQFFLNGAEYGAGLGALMCVGGCVLWAVGRK